MDEVFQVACGLRQIVVWKAMDYSRAPMAATGKILRGGLGQSKGYLKRARGFCVAKTFR
ncbi:hypothetical protein HMPREF9371_2283 [Neisseria shayeganii 871]|uniref:Uncharacterized protein n=1 Tax=Neisseria shayeganii 871 TaxID=1032488 RepID=G4CKZ2_9NEIS|nr:hypothetical protein HMPREF9371_2283 [Neisseria shayeganii 871]